MSPAETNGAPVRRGDQARHRILGAALEQLADEGATGFTMEAVARRAGASKATLYRRWPSASALLVDAMATTYRPLAAPDTGDARTDLQFLLDQVVVLVTQTRFPRLMAAVIDLAERDPALVKLHADQTTRQRQPVLEILRRGQEHGQLQAQADLETLTDLLTAPFFYRRLIAHRPIPCTMPEAIIGCIFPRT